MMKDALTRDVRRRLPLSAIIMFSLCYYNNLKPILQYLCLVMFGGSSVPTSFSFYATFTSLSLRSGLIGPRRMS